MNNSQVCHKWANGADRAKGSNLFSEGPRLYSYGYHYLLGNIFPPKGKKYNPQLCKSGLVLINSRYCSNSTARHKRHALNAIRPGYDVVFVPNPAPELKDQHNSDMEYLTAELAAAYKKIFTARDPEAYLTAYKHAGIQFDLYNNYFRLRRKLPLKYFLTEDQLSAARQKSAAYDDKRRAAEEAANARHAAKEAAALIEWRAGLNSFIFYYSPIALRLSADKTRIQTSRGAEVSLKIAKIVYDKWIVGQDITGADVCGFTVNSVSDQIIRIGCHDIPVEEIKKLFESIK